MGRARSGSDQANDSNVGYQWSSTSALACDRVPDCCFFTRSSISKAQRAAIDDGHAVARCESDHGSGTSKLSDKSARGARHRSGHQALAAAASCMWAIRDGCLAVSGGLGGQAQDTGVARPDNKESTSTSSAAGFGHTRCGSRRSPPCNTPQRMRAVAPSSAAP